MDFAEISAYIESLNSAKSLSPVLEEVYQYAARENIPAVRKSVVRFLRLLAQIARPRRVLEIGTGSGLSALAISEGMNGEGEIVTLERDENRYRKAIELFADKPSVRVLPVDAFKYLASDDTSYDMVFMDSQKRDYIDLLPLIEPRLCSGGILAVDNILFGGKTVCLSPQEEAKYAGGVELLREFNRRMAESENFDSLFLPLDDGFLVAVRK